jgi:hypothetical protein
MHVWQAMAGCACICSSCCCATSWVAEGGKAWGSACASKVCEREQHTACNPTCVGSGDEATQGLLCCHAVVLSVLDVCHQATAGE